jgi:hypothetical protein
MNVPIDYTDYGNIWMILSVLQGFSQRVDLPAPMEAAKKHLPLVEEYAERLGQV